MASLVRADTERYKQAIEAAGGVFGGSEPIQQLVKQFEGPINAAHAAAEVGLEQNNFIEQIRGNRTPTTYRLDGARSPEREHEAGRMDIGI